MTKDEVVKVAEVLATVDSRCGPCIERVCAEFTAHFAPEWTLERLFADDGNEYILLNGERVVTI